MRIHELQPAENSRSSRKRVGRGIGSGLGKTSGRGQKGQIPVLVVEKLLTSKVVKPHWYGVCLSGASPTSSNCSMRKSMLANSTALNRELLSLPNC